MHTSPEGFHLSVLIHLIRKWAITISIKWLCLIWTSNRCDYTKVKKKKSSWEGMTIDNSLTRHHFKTDQIIPLRESSKDWIMFIKILSIFLTKSDKHEFKVTLKYWCRFSWWQERQFYWHLTTENILNLAKGSSKTVEAAFICHRHWLQFLLVNFVST